MCVIFPDWGGVQQSALYWTANPYFKVFRKQCLAFQSGKLLSGHQQDYKLLRTINGHPE
jgi:hypothetical protein